MTRSRRDTESEHNWIGCKEMTLREGGSKRPYASFFCEKLSEYYSRPGDHAAQSRSLVRLGDRGELIRLLAVGAA